MTRPFPREPLAAPPEEAARALLGALLVRIDESRDGRVTVRRGRIVEVEAYGGPEDGASHARFTGSPRRAAMAAAPGRAYVYRVYGMHACLNVVTGPEGSPAAVLLRSVEPLEGGDAMRSARVAAAPARIRSSPAALAREAARLAGLPDAGLAAGPALLAAAFGVDLEWNGADLCDPAAVLRLELPTSGPPPPDAIAATSRIGVDYAPEPWRTAPLRFVLAGDGSSPNVGRR